MNYPGLLWILNKNLIAKVIEKKEKKKEKAFFLYFVFKKIWSLQERVLFLWISLINKPEVKFKALPVSIHLNMSDLECCPLIVLVVQKLGTAFFSPQPDRKVIAFNFAVAVGKSHLMQNPFLNLYLEMSQ